MELHLQLVRLSFGAAKAVGASDSDDESPAFDVMQEALARTVHGPALPNGALTL